jgi:methyl-accepting chemotaxis protein
MIRVADLRMPGKLVLVLVLPACALLLLSGQLIRQEWRSQEKLAYLARAGDLAGTLTEVVHLAQLERGRTVAWLAGRPTGPGELAEVRQGTDAAWTALTAAWKGGQRVGMAPGLLGQQRHDLDRLRERIDRRAATPAQVMEDYNTLVAGLLGVLQDLSAQAEDPAVARMLAGQRFLALAKDAAGQERAEGARLLAAGGAVGERLPALAATQDMLLELFADNAPGAIRRAWRQAEQSACVGEFGELRAALGSGSRPTPEKWFRAASCRIDHLHTVETDYARQLRDAIADLRSQGRTRLYWILLLTLLPILPSAWLIHLVARNVTGTSRWLLNAMHGISDGNFNVTLPPQSRDELGRLASGLHELRSQLSRQLAEQRQVLAREREQAAVLEQRSQEIRAFAQRMATGDLRGRLGEGSDNLGQLAANLNHMAEGLSGLASRVRESSNAMATTVSQLQGAVGSQSSGASQQAASVTETMTTLEQIRATTAQTLDKAQRLGEMSEKARAEGERGRHAVEESIAGIGAVNAKVDVIARTILALNDWAQHIGQITGAVNGIARQLRLLSLNAAIEASKAGEAGQGFAVVAGEVKQLAERSQEATEQVQHILQEIRHATDRAVMATEDGAKGVAHGLALVERAGEVIRRLEDVVRDTSVASRQIVAAVRQEAAGIEQIATAMHDIHSVTNQFVGATTETRAAAGELGHLAGRLEAAASAYRL